VCFVAYFWRFRRSGIRKGQDKTRLSCGRSWQTNSAKYSHRVECLLSVKRFGQRVAPVPLAGVVEPLSPRAGWQARERTVWSPKLVPCSMSKPKS